MRILGVLILAFGMMIVSCSKEEQWTTVDSFVQETYQEMRDGALGGHHRCYRVNFPITILFPDGSSTEVGDREEFITTLKNWKEANPDAEERPTVEFPFSITRIDGEVIEVTSKEQIAALRRECRTHNNGHRKCGKFARFIDNKCFTVQLPLSLVLPSGEIVTIENRQDVRQLLKRWKINRPDEVPEISFPLTVTIKETGETKEIANHEELDALVAACKE